MRPGDLRLRRPKVRGREAWRADAYAPDSARPAQASVHGLTRSPFLLWASRLPEHRGAAGDHEAGEQHHARGAKDEDDEGHAQAVDGVQMHEASMMRTGNDEQRGNEHRHVNARSMRSALAARDSTRKGFDAGARTPTAQYQRAPHNSIGPTAEKMEDRSDGPVSGGRGYEQRARTPRKPMETAAPATRTGVRRR
jgi:hypothetical protein